MASPCYEYNKLRNSRGTSLHIFETPGGVLGFIQGRHVCFIFLLLFLLLLSSTGELTAERIELKFSRKIDLVPVV